MAKIEVSKALEIKREASRDLPSPRSHDHEIVVLPPMQRMVDDAFALIGAELAHYRRQTKTQPLTERQARIVGGHVRSLAHLAEIERRDKELDDQVRNLTDEQLQRLGAIALERLAAAERDSK